MQRASTPGSIAARWWTRSFAAAPMVAAAVTLPTMAWLQRLPLVTGDGGDHDHGPTAQLGHWLRDSALVFPLLVLVIGAVLALCARRRIGSSWRAAAVGGASSLAVAVGSFAHPLVDGGQHGAGLSGPRGHAGVAVHTAHGSYLSHVGHAGLVFALSLPVALLAAAAASALLARSVHRRRAEAGRPEAIDAAAVSDSALTARRAIGALVSLGLVASVSVLVPAAPAAADTGGVCPVGARLVTYDVAAFQTVIPLNGWGDHLPDGLVYALKGDDARVGKGDILANPNVVQPLVVRANVGDCIRIKLRNDIEGRRVGMHADGLVSYDPRTSDGAQVGRNPDSSAGPGQEVTYTWYAEREGEAPIVDIANLSSGHGGNPAPDAPEGGADAHAADAASIERGLYGALVVHPAGSSWHDPRTGADLLDPETGRAVESALFADVVVPGAESFRSFAMVVLDENEGVLDRNGQTPTFPTTGLEDSTFGINYRSEPLRNRLRAVLEHRGTPTPENPAGEARTIRLPSGQVIAPGDHFCDGYVPDLGRVVEDPGAKCMGEESHLQSWVFGDEGKLVHRAQDGAIVVDSDNLIPKAYVGDPTRFHVVHPGAKETHPWHQHTQRWYADPNNPNSPRLDVQAVGPGESYEMRIEGGAGGEQGTIGDSIFHCHLYPHFAQGFWGHLRIFDRLRDGTQTYPDATPIEPLRPLPDRPGAIPGPDAEHPGYPLFVKGDVGQRAYRPPYAVVADQFAAIRRPGDAPRSPTPLEAANLPGLHPDRPGAGYIDPCPADAPLRTYRPHAIDVPITYNSAGWTDPEGRVYVEESHKDDVLAGRTAPEPYTIRSRVGDCVQLLTTNDLHLNDDPTHPVDYLAKQDGVYQLPEHTSEISTHVHLVRFDELGSDGTSVGWNYVQAAMPGQTYGYRWFVDQALRTVFFHDHQYANSHQQRGLFAAMNVEPVDATWHDPATGNQTDGIGVSADIRSASGPDFREFTVFYQDRAPMWKDYGAGDPVEPPAVPGDFGGDQGGYAINYRNEPFQ
ncbi:MAG: hypothetical protein QOJ19_3905, partial [Acidimicrobiia bacterium]|nr:hypothetical protein [Acidimicrobiia bacterium]